LGTAEEDLLATADLVVLGRMPWSSNATFLCELWPAGSRPDAGLADDEDGDVVLADAAHAPTVDAEPLGRAIYKPHQGERPLWDFPDGLYRREAGAYLLARAIGWDVIPTTVVRDGPFGPGSLQRFVDADFDQHYFTLLEDEAHHPQLRRMAVFDLVANSTDRKGGHVLVDDEGHLWGIDNGLSLHAEFKLRTVIWDFAGDPLPAELADDLDRFACTALLPELAELLDPFERDALHTRARAVLAEGRLPHDPTGRRYPWPLV
jgi:uncharacterized repeat protein (TIGR03843 family)